MNTPDQIQKPDSQTDNSQAAAEAEEQGKFKFHPLLDKNQQPVYAADSHKLHDGGREDEENRHVHSSGSSDPGFGATDRG
jgi:hypothetical protein